MAYMHHIGYFYIAVTKMPDRNHTRKEVFILAHGFGPQLPYVPSQDIMAVGVCGGYSHIMVDSRSKVEEGGRNQRPLVTYFHQVDPAS